MRKRLAEETVIFISVFKWFFLAMCVGGIVGVATYVFLKALEWSVDLTSSHSYYFLLLPLGLIASTIIIDHIAPDAKGHGTEKVIEAIHKASGKIRPRVVPVKLFTTIITFAVGGSVGKEGPCAQIGAGLTSALADLIRFNDIDRKKLVICGISAGFASVFGTPIAGAVFGIEVLFVGGMMYDVLLPSFVAGIVGYQVVSSLGLTFPYTTLGIVSVPQTNILFIEAAVGGIFFGLCSLFLIELMNFGEGLVKKYRFNPAYTAVAGGIALIILTFIFSTEYLGLGEHMILASLRGEDIVIYAFVLKIIFTVITLVCGGSGGIVTPIFFIGATAGTAYATMLGLNKSVFAAIGLVSLLAGAANTPITATIMAVEIFGAQMAPYAAISSVISFLMTGHRSIYPSQVLAFKKSASIDVELGKEIEEIIPQFHKRKRTLMDILWRIGATLKEKIGKHYPHG